MQPITGVLDALQILSNKHIKQLSTFMVLWIIFLDMSTVLPVSHLTSIALVMEVCMHAMFDDNFGNGGQAN